MSNRVCIEKIGYSSLSYYSIPDICFRDYYLSVCSVIKKELSSIRSGINLNFCQEPVEFGNSNPTFTLSLQPEHTLVKPGGRSCDPSNILGEASYDNENYLIRLDKYDTLKKSDAILDYSMANITHLEKGKTKSLINKFFYFSPLTYDDTFFDTADRTDIITLFNPQSSDRRKSFLEGSCNLSSPVKNIMDVFDKTDLRNIYKKSRVLVNIHQTPHHHTLEELRVLPAILNGVIVVSENVPLKNEIPYSDFVVWSEYSDMNDTIRRVLGDYKNIHNKIFSFSLKEKIENMRKNNSSSINRLLNHLLEKNH